MTVLVPHWASTFVPGSRITMFQLERIDHVALLVRDVERSARWYEEVLGLDRLHRDVWGSFPAVVGRGGTSLALFPVGSPTPNPPPGRDTICVRHVAFRVDRANFLAAQDDLKRRGIPFSSQDHQIAHSIYFEDPDGHQLEITTYELSPVQAPGGPRAAGDARDGGGVQTR